MQHIYLDNASTTFPKPQDVPDAMYHFITQIGSNINRGSYENAYRAENVVYETRELLCRMFDYPSCQNVIFTKNVTESLNIILKGFLKPGDHVIVSSMEHNAVMRPLRQLESCGISFSRIQCRKDGTLNINDLELLLRNQTRAIIMTHASNVCGTLLPLKKVGKFCQKHQLRFFVDTAQTAGVCPVSMKEMHIDALAFTGHKGLLGPQGIGGFILNEEMVPLITPLISGGTGSISHTEFIPAFMPDRFEAGTMNIPGIVGLHAGLQWLFKTGINAVYQHELALTDHFLKGLSALNQKNPRLRIVGKKDLSQRTGVVSIQPLSMDPAEVSFILENTYGIMTRVGLHCAPSAHQTLGTFPTGTIRFSFGWYNTDADIDFTLNALEKILK